MDAVVTDDRPAPDAGRTGVGPARRPRRRGAVAVATGIAAVAAVAAALAWLADGARRAEAGARAFDGRSALVARIDGHAEPLPASAAACANCHRPSAAPRRPDGSAAPDASLGPPLHQAALLAAVERRGGPASRYDAQAFCRLLRTGEDPAGVLLPRAMPRYEIDDTACGQLWTHLMRTGR